MTSFDFPYEEASWRIQVFNHITINIAKEGMCFNSIFPNQATSYT